jgi:PAS domain S-box-containing protein
MTLVAVIVHFTGDTQSPFFFLYYLPIIAAGWRYNPNIVFIPAVFGILFISVEWLLPYLFLPKSFSQFITGSPYPALILRSFTLIFVAAFVYFLARLRNESGIRLLDTISKLKKSAKELEDEKSRSLALAAALTNIGDGVFLVDTTKKILDWNRAMEKFTGIPSSDAIAKNVYKMLSVYDQLGRNVCICASRNCKKNDNINNHNEIVIHKNSQLICPKSLKNLNINHVSTPLIDTKGNVFASLEIIHNIEHEKQMTDISQLSQAIVHITSLEETIDAILPKIAQSLHSQKAIITIQHHNSDLILKHFGFEKSQSNKIKLFNYDPEVKIFSNDLQKESTSNRQLIKELKINKIMQSPLISRNQLFGSIAVINKKIGIFEKKDWRYFKTLTAYITRIIENAIIYQDLADNLDRERQFIGDIAHEFKTPLTIIKSETELAISRNRSIGYYQKTLVFIVSDRLFRVY